MTISVSTSLRSFSMPDLGLDDAALALEPERPGHHADGERAERPRHVRDHGRAAGAGAAALAGRDEHHVGALEDLLDLLAVIFGGLASDVGVGARAQSPGELAADVELDVGVAHEQRLGVRVDRDELDALESLFDHAIDGVDAATADSDDLDNRQIVLRCCHEEGTFPLVLPLPCRRRALFFKCIAAARRLWPWARETSALVATRNSPPGHRPSPSGLTFRLRFKVFVVRTIDTDSRVGRHPGQLTTREPASVSRIGGVYRAASHRRTSVSHRRPGRAHVVIARVRRHEHGKLLRLRRGIAGAAPQRSSPRCAAAASPDPGWARSPRSPTAAAEAGSSPSTAAAAATSGSPRSEERPRWW